MNDDLLTTIIHLTNDVIVNNNKLLEINKELIKMNMQKSKYVCITITTTILIIAIFLLVLYVLWGDDYMLDKIKKLLKKIKSALGGK